MHRVMLDIALAVTAARRQAKQEAQAAAAGDQAMDACAVEDGHRPAGAGQDEAMDKEDNAPMPAAAARAPSPVVPAAESAPARRRMRGKTSPQQESGAPRSAGRRLTDDERFGPVDADK